MRRPGWMLLLVLTGCGLRGPADSRPYAPSAQPQGPLTLGVWLPAGLPEFRLDADDQERLVALGINQLEWLQPVTTDSGTAEEVAMAFCGRAGLHLPVYYAPRGLTADEKLHDWLRALPAGGGDDEVARRVRLLRDQWSSWPGFAGYLVGHEDYRSAYYPALRDVVAAIRREDPARPALIVGRLDDYEQRDAFLDAFFAPGGVPNVLQHEDYVFRAQVGLEGTSLARAIDRLTQGYERVARGLEGRTGRWHAIIQAHRELRDGEEAYRRPTAAELSVQAGLALSRGASGIVYFLHSSGPERLRQADGTVREERYYEGLVDAAGAPTDAYRAAQALNGQLAAVGAMLAPLHFHGGYAAEHLADNDLLRAADGDLEVGLFGDGAEVSHVLLVNVRTDHAQEAALRVARDRAVDAVTGEAFAATEGRMRVPLAAGAFRLLAFGE